MATVCNNTRGNYPVFKGNCKHILHHGFTDPANESGTKEENIKVYRKVRNEIKDWLNLNKNEYLK